MNYNLLHDIYIVIGSYTRMTHTRAYKELIQIHSLDTILETGQYFDLNFKKAHSNKGLDFSRYFKIKLENRVTKISYTRFGKHNNAPHREI